MSNTKCGLTGCREAAAPGRGLCFGHAFPCEIDGCGAETPVDRHIYCQAHGVICEVCGAEWSPQAEDVCPECYLAARRGQAVLQ